MTGLLVIVLWPSRSFAAIVPACENDFVSRVVVPPPASDDSCDPSADDIDNSRVAPICDARGASAVAPPRLRSVSDQRFDRNHGCDGAEAARAAVSPGRGDAPIQPPETTLDRAVLPTVELVGPAPQTSLLDPLAPTGGPRMGVRNVVYHPPR